METVEAVQLINARCPELPADDLARIEVALSGEEMVPLTTPVAVILAVDGRKSLEAWRGSSLWKRDQPHRLM